MRADGTRREDLLAEMERSSRARASEAKARVPERELRARCADLPAPPALRLEDEGFDLIAEVKRRAPSAGALEARDASAETIVARARAYVDAGAVAVSVLTEPSRFDGSLADLEAVAAAIEAPTMRKDFLVDPYQLAEARAAGAGGALLIVRMLDDVRLDEMLDACRELGLFALVEAFDAIDLMRAGALLATRASVADAPVLVGLNARDLSTLEVDPSRFDELRAAFPRGYHAVAESGLASAEEASRVARAGYRLALVGSALMRADDPAALAAAMIEAGR